MANKLKEIASTSNVFKTITILIIFSVIIYYIYKYIKDTIRSVNEEPILIKKIKNAKAALTFQGKDIMHSPNAYDSTYMVWLNVNDTNWKNGSNKHVFNKGYEIQVTMAPKKNNLDIIVKKEDGGIINFLVENFPLERWFHLGVVNTMQSAEVYIDGELYQSKVINGNIHSQVESDLSVTRNGGFGGFISSFRYFNRSLRSLEIKRIYSKGPEPFQLIDLSDFIKKYTPKMDLDIKVGDWSAREFVSKEIDEIKKDYINPLLNIDDLPGTDEPPTPEEIKYIFDRTMNKKVDPECMNSLEQCGGGSGKPPSCNEVKACDFGKCTGEDVKVVNIGRRMACNPEAMKAFMKESGFQAAN